MSLMVSARRVIMPTVVTCVLMLTALTLPASADDSTPTLSPTHGPPGTSVTASATDWTGCSSMSVSGSGTTLGTAAIDSTGAFSLTFKVPSNAPTGSAQLMFSPTCTHSTVAPFVTFTVDSPGTGMSPPAAPSNLTATAVDQNDIRLNWQDNSTNETGFEINNGVISKDAGAGSTTYTWSGLASGTYMCFKIRAYNSVGDSAWDPNVSPYYVCTTTPKPPPPAAEPTIYWSRTSGLPGTHVTLTGNGWVPGGTVQIHLPSKGFLSGRSSWKVDSHGGWQQQFTVADTTPGAYKLSFSETSGNLLVTGSFRVLPVKVSKGVYCLGGSPGQACTGGSTSGGKPIKITVPKVPSELAKTLSPAKLSAVVELVTVTLRIIAIIAQIPGEALSGYFAKSLTCSGLSGADLLQCVQNTGFPQAPITKA